MSDREKFEAWAKENYFYVDVKENSWQVWQAATARVKENMNDREKFDVWFATTNQVLSMKDWSWRCYQAATAESAAKIAELEQKLVEISSLMTLWKKGLITGDELGKSLFVVHQSKPAIINTGDKT